MWGVHRVAGIWRPFGEAVRSIRAGTLSKAGLVTPAGGVFGWVAGRFRGRSAPEGSPDALFQAQKMESLGRLTGGVAHDFNNLLTVVLGNATALRVQAEARGDTQAVRRAEMIEHAAERGGRLAGQLLSFSRKQMLRPEIVSVYRVISAMHALLAQAAGETARVLLNAEAGLWNCLVDSGQLESALLNLVLNARDAMPVGGNITISCHNMTFRRSLVGTVAHAPGDYVRIDVKDTGSGIAPELREKVFEPFFTTKPFGQGSGLGLAQVHGFAGQSGGWVDLESEVGRGTTISLFLPRAEGRDVDPPPVGDGMVPVGNSETILVVEPDADLRMTTCGTLIRSGYRAIGVANGSGALSFLASDERIHALLTEARLPGGVDGLALARSARQTRPDLCLIITSSLPDNGPTAADDRRVEFVSKPYRPLDLVRVVGAVLRGNTFSVETEQLLAQARATVSRAPAVNRLETGSNVSGYAAPPPAGLRKNAIRLGVMPFRTIGSNTGVALSMGLAEEITRAFSRFRSITCVAPASVAALADEPTGQTERWRQLDLDFLVEGSFRKKGNEIRVLLRLINMRASGEITWGRRFDSPFQDVLNLQDQIASETAAQIAPELLLWEGQAAALRPQVDPTAYDLMLRAIPAIYRLDEADFRNAGSLLEQSLVLDPSSAACHSWLAHWYLFSLGQGWEKDVALAIQRAEDLSKRAVILDPGDARGFAVAGHVRAFLNKQAEAAVFLHERAIALNPNLALAWCYSGLAHSYLGQHTEAIRRIQIAQHLSPHDPHGFFFDMALGMPFLLSGQYESAALVGRRACGRHPGLSSSYKGLLAALGHLGATREAASVRRVLLGLEPQFSLSGALLRSPLTRPEDANLYVQGLRLAGIPERSRA
jgi:signal transduction histidine kinase/TolB-like protein/FixJ family two-component response regulator